MELNDRSLETAILDELVRDRVPVTVFLMNGFQIRGIISGHDGRVIVLLQEDVQNIIYKHSVSTLKPIRVLQSASPA